MSVGYALIGCGAFGQFCLEQYRTLPSVKLVGVCDRDESLAASVAAKFGLKRYASIDELLADASVQLVHIATPPGTHREIAVRSLRAGKHVLCEKPLAVTLDDGEAILAAATEAGRICVADLIMRYDPLTIGVERVMKQKLLGEPIHAVFENYAKDEKLGPGHWFWDRAASGGIFIEHGVHFYDLFAMWFGPGTTLSGQQFARPGDATVIEQVQSAARFGESVLANFYHGFTQAERMDRQEMRLLCEHGDVRLAEWLPVSATIDAIATENDAEAIAAALPNAKLTRVESFTGERRKVYSRHKHYDVDGRYAITAHAGVDKAALYGVVLRALLDDQAKAIDDPSHSRRVVERNGLESLRMAVDAQRMADESA